MAFTRQVALSENHAESPATRRSSTEMAMLHLVRAVLDDAWSAPVAARRLLEAVGGDRRVLQRVRSRVLRAAMVRDTQTSERAIVTLDLALCAETA